MVAEAEKYKKQDEEAANRIKAKNAVESYAYNLRNSINDDNLKGKFQGDDKDKLDKAVNETLAWLDSNAEASKDEYEHKLKELEGIAMPIMTKLYGQGGAPGGTPAGASGPSAAPQGEPSIEEVD